MFYSLRFSVFAAVVFIIGTAERGLAQNIMPMPSVAPAERSGIGAELLMFEAAGVARPSAGQVSYSMDYVQGPGGIEYAIRWYNNPDAQGPGWPLGRFVPMATIPTPRFAFVSAAYCPWVDLMSSLTTGISAGRFIGDRGEVPAVMELHIATPTAEMAAQNGLRELRRVNILKTFELEEEAVLHAADLAAEDEANAIADWQREGYPPNALPTASVGASVVLPTIAAPPASFRPVYVSYAEPRLPGDDINWPETCFFGASISLLADLEIFRPNGRWPLVVRPRNGDFEAQVEIAARRLNTLCQTGNPGWMVFLHISKGTGESRGRFAFEVKLGDRVEDHIAAPPDGFPGDIWVIEQGWQVRVHEYFPLELPVYSPQTRMPPIVRADYIFVCKKSVGCFPQ